VSAAVPDAPITSGAGVEQLSCASRATPLVTSAAAADATAPVAVDSPGQGGTSRLASPLSPVTPQPAVPRAGHADRASDTVVSAAAPDTPITSGAGVEQLSCASRATPLVTSAAAADATAPEAVDSPGQGGTPSSASTLSLITPQSAVPRAGHADRASDTVGSAAAPDAPITSGAGVEPVAATGGLNSIGSGTSQAVDACGSSVDLAIATVFAAYGTFGEAPDTGGSARPITDGVVGAPGLSTCAPVAPSESDAAQVASAAMPKVNWANSTVIGAYATLDEDQRQSVGTIVSMHLAAEEPKAWRARSGNGLDLLFTRATVPLKAVVGPWQARRRSLEGSSAISRLCRDDVASMEAILKGACRRANDAGNMAVVPSAAVSALPVRLRTQFVVANNISYETWQRIR